MEGPASVTRCTTRNGAVMSKVARSLPAILMVLAACDSDVVSPNRSLARTDVAARAATTASLAASGTPQTQIALSWADNSRSEAGWEVQRSTSGAAGPFTVLASLAANTAAHNDAGLTPTTTYCYRVRSFKRNGARTTYDAFSNSACTATL